ncbi:hypothetical protein, partial [Rossellomorea arthrocnemi]|uniref:hypothetical protein n=1 Tax=Rossellomorea arthrocnemi TaxID=2769542 RepID=UPI001E3C59B9
GSEINSDKKKVIDCIYGFLLLGKLLGMDSEQIQMVYTEKRLDDRKKEPYIPLNPPKWKIGFNTVPISHTNL